MNHRTQLLLLLIFCFSIVLTAQDQPILRLNTGMHSTRIKRLDVDPVTNNILTISADKTAKLWDTKGRLLQTYRPYIGMGDEGMLFAGAVCPNKDQIAVGGWTKNTGKTHCAYIFSKSSGEIIKKICGLPNVIQDIEYSPDGRFLVLTMGGANGMRAYRTSTFSMVSQDKYGDNTYCAVFDPNGRLATASYDGYVRLYDDSFELLKKVKPKAGKRPFNLAFSRDAKLLAVCYNDTYKIEVLEANNLTLVYEPDVSKTNSIKERFSKLLFSPDNKQLVAAGLYDNNIDGKSWHMVRIWEKQGRGTYQDHAGSTNTIIDMKFLSNTRLVFCSTEPDWGILNTSTGQKELYTPSPLLEYSRRSKSHLRISPDGFEIGAKPLHQSPFLFRLSNRALLDKQSTKEQYKDKHGSLTVSKWSVSSSPQLNGKPLSFLNKYEDTYSTDISHNSKRVVFGADWHLYCVNEVGKLQWSTPSQAPVWAVNIAKNGQTVVAALGDGTIVWYRMSDGKPLLNFFLHPDRTHWILWTASGYYDCAPGAEELLGWHVNQGSDRASLFYSISKFRDEYYRPDVIDRILETVNEAEALQLANASSNRTTTARRRNISNELPPSAKILSPSNGASISANEVSLRFNIFSPNNTPVTGIQVLLNGRPVPQRYRLKEGQTSGRIKVQVPSEDCRISLLATNQFGTSEAASVQLKWQGGVSMAPQILKPTLYVLAVGVSKYQNEEYRLDFAAKDATDFANSIKRQHGKLYKKVEVKLLTNETADRGNILDGLDWLVKETTQHDVAMLFFAGHGMENNSGTFYYLPVEADASTLRRNGIMKEEIKETVHTIAGKVILFMDACHSGKLMGTTRRRAAPDITPIINELVEAENGAIIFSSSAGRQFSLEDATWNNGAFTKALVEGLNGKADLFRNGKITCKTLDSYITQRVKLLTKGTQSPTTNFPPNVEDFPIAVGL